MLPLAVLLAFTATPAFAHTGHGPVDGFMSGFAHPFMGLDHLLAMVAVGLVAGAGPGLGWRAPAAFLGAMLAGFLMQSAGAVLPLAELVVAGSVAALGLGLLLGTVAPASVFLAATALFGFFHGYVHGVEAGANGLAGYGLGFLAATATLHLAGYAAAHLLDFASRRPIQIATGGIVTVAGLALVAAQVA